MRTRILRLSIPSAGLLLSLTAFTLVPATAHAQYSAPEMSGGGAIGEKYHAEVSGTLWNPDLYGQISSEQFGLLGTKIDLVDDLGYAKTRFKDFRLVLRPSKKAKFRVQYTPIQYEADTKLRRNLVFNGISFPLAIPVSSQFNWNVWRLGYEYDVLYKSRGFVGFLLEGRYTEFNATVAAPVLNESQFTSAKAPLPAIGVVGRGYVLPELAINFEVSGFKLPNINPKYQANYFDWDINGTMNVTNNFGLQVGWRKMTTYLGIKNDIGDIRFQGMWLGAALRY